MCRSEIEDSFNVDLPVRSYRRPMKPILKRKISSSARINLNKFWNDLEEFYNTNNDRLSNFNDSLKTEYQSLPDYTTDTFDHDRETAENELNEKIELDCMSYVSSSSYMSRSSNFECQSTFCDEDNDSGNEEEWEYSSQSSYSSYSAYSSQSDLSLCDDSEFIQPTRSLLHLFKQIASKWILKNNIF